MTDPTPTCPICQYRLRVMYFRISASVECVNPNCAFRLDEISRDLIINAVMADHMRPLDEPHAYVAHPDYAGCDAPTGNPVKACGRSVECHPPAKADAIMDAVRASNAAGIPFISHEPESAQDQSDIEAHGQHERFTP